MPVLFEAIGYHTELNPVTDVYCSPKILWRILNLKQGERRDSSDDIWSLGLIGIEMYLERSPYFDYPEDLHDILSAVANTAVDGKSNREEKMLRRQTKSMEDIKKFVPFPSSIGFYADSSVDMNHNNGIIDIFRECITFNPKFRLSASALRKKLGKVPKSHGKNLVDSMVEQMEVYSKDLEARVEERTRQVKAEKAKMSALLSKMLPKIIAKQLIAGKSVHPEYYDSCTVYFSDIVGFTSMSANATPLQIVKFLNDLYTSFDNIISVFDCYKVETIGDAYMVVSGLPERNGKLHVPIIADMALSLRELILQGRIKGPQQEQVELRIGMHTDPCATGVVGLQMPRYCLFGDTVNKASRMESSSESLKIHLSQESHEVLASNGNYNLECRGMMELKGLVPQKTYWLLEKKADISLLQYSSESKRNTSVTEETPGDLGYHIKEELYF